MNRTSPELLRGYVAAGDKIRIEANTIFNLTRQLELSDTDEVVLDPVVLEHINQILVVVKFFWPRNCIQANIYLQPYSAPNPHYDDAA